MPNILLESYRDWPSFRLTSAFFNALREYSKIGLRIKLTRYITKEDLEWCDIFISLRGYNKLSEYLAQQAVKYGKFLILSIDDDLLNVPYPKVSKIIDNENKEALRQIINLSNALLVPNSYLGNKYSGPGRSCCVANTIVDKNELIKRSPNESDCIKIVYPAHVGHKVFFDKYISPNLGKLYERYGNRLMYYFIGPDIQVDDPRIHIVHHHTMAYDVYNQYMKENFFDIGVAPLFDTEVCRCKYFNKYIEYSKFGIAGIYSNLMPYTMVVKNEINGLLVDNSVEAWYVALCKFIDSRDLREKCVCNAQEQLEKEHDLNYILVKLIHDLPQIVTYTSSRQKIGNLKNMYLWFWYNEFRRKCIYR